MTTGEATENVYLGALRGLRGTAVLVGVFSALINLLMLTGPVYMLQIYDRVLSSGSVATLLGLFAIVVVLYGFLGLYEFLRRGCCRARRCGSMPGSARRRCASRCAPARGDTRPERELETIRGFLSGGAITGLFDLPWTPLFLGLLFLIHPWLGVLTLAGAGVVAVAALLNHWLTRGATRRAMALDAAERGLVDQARGDVETLQALGMRERLVARWREMHDAALAAGQVGGDRSEGFGAFSKSFRLLLQSAILTMGAFLALRQEITPGMIIAASIIAGRALAPVDQVIGQWRAIAAPERRIDACARPSTGAPDEKPRIDLPAPAGDLQVTALTSLAPAGEAPGIERRAFSTGSGFRCRRGTASAWWATAPRANPRWRGCSSAPGSRMRGRCGSTGRRSTNGRPRPWGAMSGICRNRCRCCPAAWARTSRASTRRRRMPTSSRRRASPGCTR